MPILRTCSGVMGDLFALPRMPSVPNSFICPPLYLIFTVTSEIFVLIFLPSMFSRTSCSRFARRPVMSIGSVLRTTTLAISVPGPFDLNHLRR
ncbi:MAG: hypothetical protein MZV70_02560 [Desulfobacterales bacterium]|nr:hypothetical protein [Desulfobacterales bacterium]